MEQRYLDYARVVAVMAQQRVLLPDMAMAFCANVLPQILAEMEVLHRLADTKFGAAFTVDEAPAAEPPVAVQQPVARATRRPAKKKSHKARKPKNARHAEA